MVPGLGEGFDPGGVLIAVGRQLCYAMVIFVPVAITTQLLGRRLPAVRQALWLLVVVRLVLPPDLASVHSVRAWWFPEAPPAVGVAFVGHGSAMVPGHSGVPASLSAAPAQTSVRIDGYAWTPGRTAAAGWMGLWILGTVWTWRRFRERRRLALAALETPVDTRRITSRVEVWRRRFRIRRRVQVWTGDVAVGPFTVGVIRPRIFLPRRLLTGGDALDAKTLDAILGHEMAHIARLDDLRLGLMHGLRAVYFFFPVAWIVAARLDEISEQLCDQWVLWKGIVPPRDYARALVRVLELGQPTAGAVAALGFSKRRFIMRLNHILRARPRRRPGTWPSLAVVALLGAVVLPMATVTPTAIAADPPQVEPQPMAAGAEPPMLLSHPLPDARVTASFGPMQHPIKGEKVHHDGLDLVKPEGEPVLAAADGRVLEADLEAGDHGILLVIDHGHGVVTRYSHLSALDVSQGDIVRSGQAVAKVGNTGLSTGPHLHFEVLLNGEPVDPKPFLDGDC